MEEEESRGTVVPQHRHKYMGDLSPVQESPEYKSEEMNYQELEKDLNLALSKLDSAISQLPSDLTEETQITHTVMTITSTQQQQQQQPAEEEDDSLFQGDIATHFLTLSYPIQILKPKLLSDSFQIVDTCNFVLFASLSTLQ